MKYFFSILPFILVGVFLGQGPYSIVNWEWWAMLVPLNISIVISKQIGD